MKNAIVKLGFCLLFFCAAHTALAVAPTVVVSRIGGSPTNASFVDFNVHFDQSVTGFGEAADYNFTGTGGATASGFLQSGTGQDYVVRVTGYTVGTVTLEIKAGAAVNGGAEANVVSAGGVPTFTFDNVKPTVTINKKGSQNDPTGTSPVLFTITFNEAINFAGTFAAGDIDLSASTTGAGTVSVTNLTETTPGLVYEATVTVTGAAVAGNVIASLGLDVVQDLAGNGNAVSTSTDNSVAWITKPVLGPPTLGTRTATNPTTASAVLGGEVLDDGGASVTSRGSVWSFTPGVTIGDHFSDTGYGTGEGVFANTRTANLTAQTLVYYRAFATNAAGTTLSTESSFYTLSSEPGSDRSVTATAASTTRIDLAFTSFNGITACDGMVILRKTGSAILDSEVVMGVAPQDQPLFLFDVTDNSDNDYADLTVTAGTHYYYAVIPYNYDATNDIDETHNYRLGFSNDDEWSFNKSSVIELDDPATAQLAYASKQSATINNTSDGLEVMRLEMHDGGLSHNDNDGKKTILKDLVIDITNSSMLRRVALFKGSTKIMDKAPGAQVTFNNINAGDLEANSNSNQEFQIIASFQNTGIVDGTVIQFTINSATVHPNSSEFAFSDARAGASAATTGTTNNAINVIATVYELVGPSGTISPGGAFGFTATLKDGNGFVDTNIGGNVVLNLQTGDGTLTPAPNLTAAITSGVATFSGLVLSEAGNKEIRLHSTNGAPAVDYDLPVNVQSLGVIITGPVAQEFCFNDASTTSSTFTTLTPIVILESSKSDFGVGVNQTFSLGLPAGFIFDMTVLPTLGEIGNEVTNLSTIAFTSNNVVRIKYDVTGNTNGVKDQITISGLKVKYVGTTVVTAQKIVRVGGTAYQEKNSEIESPLKSHGTLTSINGATVVDFINTNGGGISATETNFSKNSSTPIVLQGKRSSDNASIAGVFSGPGITLDGDGKYKFVANSLAVGVYDITFTYTDPVAPNCKSVVTKQFTVYTSIVNGLNTQYCVDDTPSTLLGPTSFNPGGYCYDSFLGLIYFNATRFTYPATNQFVWYNPVNGTYNIIAAPNNQFNPAAPEYQAAINQYGYIYVGYRATDACNPGFDAYFVDFVRIYKKPTLDFTPAMNFGACSTDDPVDLTGTFFDKDGTFDEFWSSAVGAPGTSANGVSGDRTAGFEFDPGDANVSGATDIQVQINYKHLNDTTGCSNQIAKVINVWRKPPQVPTSVISIRGVSNDTSGEFCQELDPPTPFQAASVAGKFYKWYDATSTNQVTAEGSLVFSPTAYLPTTAGTLNIATTTFNITQSERRVTIFSTVLFQGCESDARPLTVQIFAPTTISAGSTTTICEGNPVDLQTLGAFITPPSGSLQGTWSSTHATDAGTFGGGDDRFPSALAYNPSPTEVTEGLVTLRLRSDDPTGPCGFVESFVSVRINPGTTVSFPVSPVEFCASIVETSEMRIEGKVSTPSLPFTWTVFDGNGNVPVADQDKTVTRYVPSFTELNEGADVELKLTTADPDGPLGPCGVVSGTVHVLISQRPKVVAGPDYEICVDQPINLISRIPPTGNPVGDLTKSSASSVTWSTSNGLGTIAAPGSLTTTYDAFDPDEVENSKAITFTVTSDTPSDTPGVYNICPAEKDEVTITVHPRPGAPTPINPPNYCVGDVIDLLRVAGTFPTWYNNPDLLPAHVIIAGNNALSTSVTSLTEKQVPFYVTQTTDKTSTFAGCESVAVTMTVVVNPLPTPNFTYANQCLGDIMQFTDGSTLAQPSSGSRSIVSWQWNFDDGLGFTDASAGPIPAGTQDGRTTGTFKDPGHQFRNTGLYNVRLALVTSDGCTANITKPAVKVGQIPEAKFASRMVCDNDDTEFAFTGANPEAGTTYSYAWDFNDPSSGASNTSTVKDPKHIFSGVDTYDVVLTVTTDLNCQSSVTIPTSILPYINTFPYIEAFETPNHGWVSQGFPETSWNLSTGENHIKAPGFPAGGTFWVTNKDVGGQNTYTNGERSVLYGPCVDMTNLDRPVLAMDYWSDTEGKGDGAYIEVMDESVNNPVWVRLGDNTSGLDWYNDSSIGGLAKLGAVGQELSQFGWSGETDAWKTGRYNLDNFADKTRLRFRVVFGSNGSQPLGLAEPFDGFAMDYFKLETRNRLVLVENFTSRSTSAVVTNNRDAFKAFPSAAASSEVVKIEYHTGLPAAAGDPVDEIFQQNPMDPNARASFYGLSSVPRGYIDGYTNTAGAGLFAIAGNNWATTYYSTESLVTSPLDITIETPSITNGVIKVTGTVTAKEFDLKANAYSIYVAIVEETVGSDSYVLRKMLPSASGRKVPATLRNGSFTFTETWSIDRTYLTASPKLIAVAFVQSDVVNPGTGKREVLQAAFNSDVPTFEFTTGVEIPFLEQTALYPNPADRLVNIELPDPTKTGVEVNVIDGMGRSVIKSSIGIGERKTTIDTGALAGAVYIVQLRENGVFTNRKLLVTHKH